ncbi:hypothetical protein Cni_G24687 [Canna indica]|uniref:RING-type domain-containing protein n=1 Tax=Canna indica TaxID=4628 RepID=A0AAQ3QKC4_9LILI|nr:hypothetical protein Cni_G24687 [Canna indica]
MAGVSSSAGEDDPQAPTPPCPICLQPIKLEAYMDRCFHSFCYQCIAQWIRYVGGKHAESMTSIRCPLCKIENLSVVYGFNGKNFQRHYVNKSFERRCLSDAHDFRMQFYINETAELTNDMFNVEQYWKRCKYFQKNIWIQEWLRREIQTLTQDKDSDIIVHHIYGIAESFFRRQGDSKATAEQKRKEFRNLISEAARPFLAGYTERFVNELELFLVSGLNIEAYDKVCMQRRMCKLSSGEASHTIDGELYDQNLLGNCLHYLDEEITEIAE